jgi:GDP-L-fucose synthase
MFENMNTLVAGGAGFVGANLINRLLSLGANVRATIHRKAPVIVDERIEYMRCDLTRMRDCRKAVSGIDYVFLCAANTSGAAVIQSTPLVHVTPNIVMNSQMLEAAYFAKVKKFVWLSSNAAYPPSGDRPVKEDDFFDGDPYEAYFGVGWMKRYTEILCRMYSEKLRSPMATVVLRPSNIYGPYDDFEFETSHVMAALIRRVVERHDPIEVWGTGDDIRDWIYVDDFVDAMVLAVEKVKSYNPINIGLGKGHSIKEALQISLEVDGYAAARVEFDFSKPSMIPIRLIDTTKAETILGFRAKTGLREGIGKTIEWYRRTHAAESPPAKTGNARGVQ